MPGNKIVSMDTDEIDGGHNSDGPEQRRGPRPGPNLLRAARFLPLVTVAAWIITIFVPILDSGNDDGPRIRITSVGETPLDPEYLSPGFIAIWLLIVSFAILPWLFGVERWWSGSAIVLGALLLLVLAAAVINPPSLLWDGQTDDGMPTGGMEVALPDFGFALCLIGSQALGAAGFCGWIGSRRRRSGA